MIYNPSPLEKNSILSLFDLDYDDFLFYKDYKREELIQFLCTFLKEFSNQKGVENLQSAFYFILNSSGYDENFKDFFKNMILVNQILIDKYDFLFLECIQKDLDTISKFDIDKDAYISATCEYCKGDGEILSEEEDDYDDNSTVICFECGGCGEVDLDNPNWHTLYDKDVDTIKLIEFDFKKNIKFVIDNIIEIVLKEKLHPEICTVYKVYNIISNVKNF